MSKADLSRVLSARARRWSTVVMRFGARADMVVDQLIRAGGVVLRCEVDEVRTNSVPPVDYVAPKTSCRTSV